MSTRIAGFPTAYFATVIAQKTMFPQRDKDGEMMGVCGGDVSDIAC
jgi:hypothetical protein